MIRSSSRHQPDPPALPKTRPVGRSVTSRRKPGRADRRTDEYCSFYPNYLYAPLLLRRREITLKYSSDWTGVMGRPSPRPARRGGRQNSHERNGSDKRHVRAHHRSRKHHVWVWSDLTSAKNAAGATSPTPQTDAEGELGKKIKLKISI